MILEFSLNWNSESSLKEERIEIFDYKNVTNFEKFDQLTNNNDDLKHCFHDINEDLEKSSKRWLKILKNIIKVFFTKIRVQKKKISPELDLLF